MSTCRLRKDQGPSSQQASPPKDEAAPLAEADTAVLDEFNRNLAQYGEEVASKQQNMFSAALEDAKSEAEGLDNAEASKQQALQLRQKQEDYIKRNAKHISPSLHAQMQRGASSARPDTFSRRSSEGITQRFLCNEHCKKHNVHHSFLLPHGGCVKHVSLSNIPLMSCRSARFCQFRFPLAIQYLTCPQGILQKSRRSI